MNDKNRRVKGSLRLPSILAQHPFESRLDMEILLCHILSCRTIDLYKDPQRIVTRTQYRRSQGLIGKYNRGWPVAYLTGHKEFMSLDFIVTQDVLIPRPETEILVEQALKYMVALTPDTRRRTQDDFTIFDIGTGSGNIAVSIAKHSPIKNLRVIASDISRSALRIARLNAQRHKIPQMSLLWLQRRQKQSSSISFCQGSLFKPFMGIKADLIVSNPPYVNRADKSKWQPGLKYEPSKALWAGKKGMAYIENIIKQAPEYLKPGGWLLVEIGIRQAKEAIKITKSTGTFRDIKIIPDYNRIPRVLVANRC